MVLKPQPGLVGWALALCLLACVTTQGISGVQPAWRMATIVLLAVSHFTANVTSGVLGRRIALDHDRGTMMRLAWNLVTIGVLVNACRVVFELAFQSTGRYDSATYPALGLRQILVASSFLILTAALGAMWSAFTTLQLGIRLHAIDWTLIGCIVLLVPTVIWNRQTMGDSGSPWAVVRYLQISGPVLLAIPASMGIVLYRVSEEMGAGSMALALKCLAGSLGLRLSALAAASLLGPDGNATGASAASLVPMVFYITAHWIFLLGLVHRWRLSHQTTDLIERYESDQENQLTMLVQQTNNFRE
jgi:hypothetical protein